MGMVSAPLDLDESVLLVFERLEMCVDFLEAGYPLSFADHGVVLTYSN